MTVYTSSDATYAVSTFFQYFSKMVGVLCVGDAVWDAGDRSCRLAEEHHLQTLCSQQQADYVVLAGES